MAVIRKPTLADKKQKALYDKSDSDSKFYVTTAKETIMSASFARADHINDDAMHNIHGPIMYQLKLMQEEINELRRVISNEVPTTSSFAPVSSSFATLSSSYASTSRGLANLPTSATGLSSGDLYVLAEKDKTKTIKIK